MNTQTITLDINKLKEILNQTQKETEDTYRSIRPQDIVAIHQIKQRQKETQTLIKKINQLQNSKDIIQYITQRIIQHLNQNDTDLAEMTSNILYQWTNNLIISKNF